MYAYSPNGIVADVRAELPEFHPDLVAQYREVPSHLRSAVKPGWKFRDGTYTAPPAPQPAEATIPDVTASQAKVALFRAGYLPAVKAAVEAVGGEAEIWFQTALTWKRNNPHVIKIGSSLMEENEMDDLFRAAALIAE